MVARQYRGVRADRDMLLQEMGVDLRNGDYIQVAITVRKLALMGAPLKAWERLRIDDVMNEEVKKEGVVHG